MCGIGGICLRPGAQLDMATHLKGMIGLQRHRGPDADGIWMNSSDGVGLSHNRLAILDLTAAGNQPMHSADARYVIVFNGEIYNHQQLRRELESHGAAFRSHSDTEVLIEAYRRWGEDMLTRLRGMFAFALYDTVSRTLFCARDRMGKKPFVFAETSSGFVFASEIPAVRTVPDVDSGFNHPAIAAMLLHNVRHIPDPHTAYRGIQRLRAGHAVVVKYGRIARAWRFWTPAAASGAISPERLREMLEEAVRLRMVADVPVGALLSGGVDSSAIVALMARFSREPVRTYALGFDASDEDLRRARLMADRVGCIHKEFYFDPERQWEIFRSLIATYGEPIMLLPLIHAVQLSEAIHSDGVKVVLGGHGADELFYGYTGHVRTAWISDVMPLLGALARGGTSAIRGKCPPTLSMLAARPGARKADYYRHCALRDWSQVISADARSQLRNLVAEELAYWGPLCPSKRFIDESNFVALMVENTHSVTTSADLPPMLASVEMRAPFLDQDIVEFALATPVRRKVPWLRPLHRLKWILRQAVRDLVPHELLFAPKRGFGFGIPQDRVLRDYWRSHGETLLGNPESAGGLFDLNGIRAAWEDFKLHGSRGSNVVANLFAIQHWLQAEGSVQ